MATNVAAAANGGSASATGEIGGFLASGAINGNRTISDWGSNGGWASNFALPQTLTVTFDATYSIDEVNVITYGSASAPTLSTTISSHGAKDYTVEMRIGGVWTSVASVTNNDKVWRQFTFAAVSADAMRVSVSAVHTDSVARLVEVEAMTAAGGGGGGTNALFFGMP